MKRQHADVTLGHKLHQALPGLPPGQGVEAGHGLVEDGERDASPPPA